MVNRRELLQAGAALGAMPFLTVGVGSGRDQNALARSQVPAPAESAVTESVPSGFPLYKLIFDRRLAAGVDFGREAGRLRGTQALHAIEGDVTDLWYHDLHPRWIRQPEAIAGLTAHGAIFCLERLAWDAGMRVVFRVDHHEQPDGSVLHVAQGSSPCCSATVQALNRAGTGWATLVARLVTDSVGSVSATTGIAPLGPPTAGLVSWVIAPVVRA
jgi:hypothetical protein